MFVSGAMAPLCMEYAPCLYQCCSVVSFFVVIERLGEAQLAVSNIIRSVSTIFFVIVNSFAATTGALVSNLIGAGERQYLFPLCRKILKLGYAIGLPLIVLAMVFVGRLLDSIRTVLNLLIFQVSLLQ